jgi:hypothetical protein
MKTQVARDLGEHTSRRGFLRMLGSAAAVGAVGATGLIKASEAKRKKKGKNKCQRCTLEEHCIKGKCVLKDRFDQQTTTCHPGAPVAQLSVPYTGVAVLTPVLAQGQVYTVQVSGSAPTNATHSVDAEYDFLNAAPNTTVDVAGTVDVGLSIDDATVDTSKSPKWGAYNPAHVYSQQIIGQGRPASLLMQDSVYSDNAGAVSVTITCGEPLLTAGPPIPGLPHRTRPSSGGWRGSPNQAIKAVRVNSACPLRLRGDDDRTPTR